MVSEVSRAIGKSKNLGVSVLYGGHNLPPLVEIGLIDLPKSGGAITPWDDRPGYRNYMSVLFTIIYALL